MISKTFSSRPQYKMRTQPFPWLSAEKDLLTNLVQYIDWCRKFVAQRPTLLTSRCFSQILVVVIKKRFWDDIDLPEFRVLLCRILAIFYNLNNNQSLQTIITQFTAIGVSAFPRGQWPTRCEPRASNANERFPEVLFSESLIMNVFRTPNEITSHVCIQISSGTGIGKSSAESS